MIVDYAAVVAGGFLGSSHCVGMCGGFAAAIAATDRPFWPIFARQLVYNAGRIFTYGFLGSLAGMSGILLSQYRFGPINPQQILSIFAGVTMLLVGFSALGLIRLPRSVGQVTAGIFSPLYSYFLNGRGWWGYFAAGLANGFLPCGLVYSFLALAAAQKGPGPGALLMILFGLGTMPAMMVIGCGANFLSHTLRIRIYRMAAVFVLALGLLTLWRGWPREAPCCDNASSIAIRQLD